MNIQTFALNIYTISGGTEFLKGQSLHIDKHKMFIRADYIKHFKLKYITLSLSKNAHSDVPTFSLISYVLLSILNGCIFFRRVRVQQ